VCLCVCVRACVCASVCQPRCGTLGCLRACSSVYAWPLAPTAPSSRVAICRRKYVRVLVLRGAVVVFARFTGQGAHTRGAVVRCGGVNLSICLRNHRPLAPCIPLRSSAPARPASVCVRAPVPADPASACVCPICPPSPFASACVSHLSARSFRLCVCVPSVCPSLIPRRAQASRETCLSRGTSTATGPWTGTWWW